VLIERVVAVITRVPISAVVEGCVVRLVMVQNSVHVRSDDVLVAVCGTIIDTKVFAAMNFHVVDEINCTCTGGNGELVDVVEVHVHGCDGVVLKTDEIR